MLPVWIWFVYQSSISHNISRTKEKGFQFPNWCNKGPWKDEQVEKHFIYDHFSYFANNH